MQLQFEFKNGIVIDSWLGVCIDDNADFWKLPPQEAIDLLKEAKSLLFYAHEIERIYWFKDNTGEDPRAHYNLDFPDIGEKVLPALNNIDNNPLADEEIKEYSHLILDKYKQNKAKKRLKRTTQLTIRKQVILRDNKTCQYCGEKLNPKDIHIDHVIPYSLGGGTELNNLVVACADCNLKKSGNTLEKVNMKLINSKQAGLCPPKPN